MTKSFVMSVRFVPSDWLSQVNYHARCYHLTPFSAVAVMYSITKAQVPTPRNIGSASRKDHLH